MLSRVVQSFALVLYCQVSGSVALAHLDAGCLPQVCDRYICDKFKILFVSWGTPWLLRYWCTAGAARQFPPATERDDGTNNASNAEPVSEPGPRRNDGVTSPGGCCRYFSAFAI